MTVLVVEDDMPIRNLISTTLKTHDYKFLTANDGNDAIMQASSHNPDVVLLDLGLPDIDGIEVIKKIRSSTTHQLFSCLFNFFIALSKSLSSCFISRLR